MMPPESMRVSYTQPIPGFHVYPQGSRFSGECSLEVSIVAPSTPAPVTTGLNATPMAGVSSSGGMRKHHHEMPVDMLSDARNLFDEKHAAVDDDTANRFLDNVIFEGGAPAAGAYSAATYDPDEIQSQDGRVPFTEATNDPHDTFMQDQVSLDGFLLDHEFPEDYGLVEEEDDMDIDEEPLFEEELANQTVVGAKTKRKSKRTKAYMPTKDMLLSVEDHGDGEKARPRGETNLKKEDKRDAASIALLEKMEGMISKKYLREEKRRQEKEEQMNAFMEIQRRRLEMDV
ncbi:Eyes absent-like protein 4 [Hordeum vulgare]|nr:Eyes absent-like protein 4 [Hordeum vulgare]